MQKFFALILLLSLALNSYLLIELRAANLALQSSGAAISSTVTSKSNSRLAQISPSDADLQGNNLANNTATIIGDKALQQQSTETYTAPQNMSRDALFSLIQAQHAQQQFADLALALRDYLKRYPNDYKAWLIEADLIMHSESLSTAIAFYYDLLEKNLPPDEEDKVRSIIQVNTSKAIQQLAGDTAWDLLATFIEPLIQIDPLNPRYIMGLAKAYGKQGQVSLMENALAALPFEDARAQQLRNSIYAASTNDDLDVDDTNTTSEQTETASVSKRKIPVTGNGRQFFVKTRINRHSQTLLLDTGASTTALSNKVFQEVPSNEREFVGRFTVQTAGGIIEAPLFRLLEMKLGDITINNVSVIVLPNESFKGQFQGLLGMNVLRNFDFRFDQNSQKMTLFER